MKKISVILFVAFAAFTIKATVDFKRNGALNAIESIIGTTIKAGQFLSTDKIWNIIREERYDNGHKNFPHFEKILKSYLADLEQKLEDATIFDVLLLKRYTMAYNINCLVTLLGWVNNSYSSYYQNY